MYAQASSAHCSTYIVMLHNNARQQYFNAILTTIVIMNLQFQAAKMPRLPQQLVDCVDLSALMNRPMVCGQKSNN